MWVVVEEHIADSGVDIRIVGPWFSRLDALQYLMYHEADRATLTKLVVDND